MTDVFIKPFEFEKIFINYFLGGHQLFIFAFVFLFSFVAAKYQMSNMVFLTLLVIGALLFAAYLGEAIYLLIIVVVGFITFRAISSLVT